MNIYVGNLTYSTTEDDLRTSFSAFGTVNSVKIITDRETGRSKGFGFIEMSDDAAGSAAIKELDGQEMGERAIKVNEARPREDRKQILSPGSQRGPQTHIDMEHDMGDKGKKDKARREQQKKSQTTAKEKRKLKKEKKQ